MPITLTPLTAAQFRRRVPEMVSIYIRAMGYSSTISGARQSAWNTHSRYLGFHSVAAIEHPAGEEPNPKDPTQPIRGFIYGYRGGNGQWWNTQVKAALMVAGVPPSLRIQLLDNYTELTEIHVDPSWQGNNIGRRLLTILADSLTSQRLLLSTPEVTCENNRAFHLYRRLGFTDVVRNMHFPGDPRPFAILGSRLPLGDHSPLI
ncbi:GNAT family N-acetyltransferase [Corynebacterium sp. 23_3061]|uniref:GNAT family N-acetyltransferase n=1 Tax=Corynebacterium kroppenstedtii TaxID=161879 RepID=UPI00195E635D|nr:N-acetyltransferase [Corynebacterium kroppenstedtii]QRQ64828.1 GNAT family N-acetyltransferase [Corynebacterium kroppenstedtii]